MPAYDPLQDHTPSTNLFQYTTPSSTNAKYQSSTAPSYQWDYRTPIHNRENYPSPTPTSHGFTSSQWPSRVVSSSLVGAVPATWPFQQKETPFDYPRWPDTYTIPSTATSTQRLPSLFQQVEDWWDSRTNEDSQPYETAQTRQKPVLEIANAVLNSDESNPPALSPRLPYHSPPPLREVQQGSQCPDQTSPPLSLPQAEHSPSVTQHSADSDSPATQNTLAQHSLNPNPLQPDSTMCFSPRSTGPSMVASVGNDANQPLSWAARNPGCPVIPPRSHPVKKTKHTRAERLLIIERNRAKNEALATSLDALRLTLDQGLKKIAEDHGTSLSRIRALFYYNKKFKPSARPSLGNALVSLKAHELNAGTCSANFLL